jgi:hypothetical protein
MRLASSFCFVSFPGLAAWTIVLQCIGDLPPKAWGNWTPSYGRPPTGDNLGEIIVMLWRTIRSSDLDKRFLYYIHKPL